jgi:hypothetical protein
VAIVPVPDAFPDVTEVDVAIPENVPVPDAVLVVAFVPTKPMPRVPFRMRVVGTYPVMVAVAVTVADTGWALVA